jgi:hypothetical protein
LTGRENLSAFKIVRVDGARDGDRFDAQVALANPTLSGQELTVELHFTVGTPETTLKSGRWQWTHEEKALSGTVAAQSVMFLGGQSAGPSFGGTYDLLDSSGAPAYRITIPMTNLRPKFQFKQD